MTAFSSSDALGRELFNRSFTNEDLAGQKLKDILQHPDSQDPAVKSPSAPLQVAAAGVITVPTAAIAAVLVGAFAIWVVSDLDGKARVLNESASEIGGLLDKVAQALGRAAPSREQVRSSIESLFESVASSPGRLTSSIEQMISRLLHGQPKAKPTPSAAQPNTTPANNPVSTPPGSSANPPLSNPPLSPVSDPPVSPVSNNPSVSNPSASATSAAKEPSIDQILAQSRLSSAAAGLSGPTRTLSNYFASKPFSLTEFDSAVSNLQNKVSQYLDALAAAQQLDTGYQSVQASVRQLYAQAQQLLTQTSARRGQLEQLLNAKTTDPFHLIGQPDLSSVESVTRALELYPTDSVLSVVGGITGLIQKGLLNTPADLAALAAGPLRTTQGQQRLLTSLNAFLQSGTGSNAMQNAAIRLVQMINSKPPGAVITPPSAATLIQAGEGLGNFGWLTPNGSIRASQTPGAIAISLVTEFSRAPAQQLPVWINQQTGSVSQVAREGSDWIAASVGLMAAADNGNVSDGGAIEIKAETINTTPIRPPGGGGPNRNRNLLVGLFATSMGVNILQSIYGFVNGERTNNRLNDSQKTAEEANKAAADNTDELQKLSEEQLQLNQEALSGSGIAINPPPAATSTALSTFKGRAESIISAWQTLIASGTSQLQVAAVDYSVQEQFGAATNQFLAGLRQQAVALERSPDDVTKANWLAAMAQARMVQTQDPRKPDDRKALTAVIELINNHAAQAVQQIMLAPMPQTKQPGPAAQPTTPTNPAPPSTLTIPPMPEPNFKSEPPITPPAYPTTVTPPEPATEAPVTDNTGSIGQPAEPPSDVQVPPLQ